MAFRIWGLGLRVLGSRVFRSVLRLREGFTWILFSLPCRAFASRSLAFYQHARQFRFPESSRSPKVGNPKASILKSHVEGIPAQIVLNPVSDFLGFALKQLPTKQQRYNTT